MTRVMGRNKWHRSLTKAERKRAKAGTTLFHSNNKGEETEQNIANERENEEPSEEEVNAKKAEEEAKAKRKIQLISDMDIIPQGAFLWESIYPKGDDGLPKYN